DNLRQPTGLPRVSTRQQLARAGLPKREGGKDDNVSYVLARRSAAISTRRRRNGSGVRARVTSASVDSALHERCRCSVEKEWTEYPLKWF
ncbi:unnamed protein product, partial [Pylaiella littoralis]